ncbi:LPS O-antigen chain length determinant protein WzzB [Edwardsiella tarda]|uniref:LPS O-antigen chain length determinant protein WzzB n=1 Tax=Edwardsiella tarda TaxID=636 RepID=UPI0026708411|nr:LPS O-antigen chain length determinant protein WzzB [Edwardsiella tarda]WKS82656.1 LPS O-antigen chain length determinant protein WzzB [Edwardsiella tarda]
MQKSTIDCTTDEIDLLDIIKQLWQGRRVVFCTTLLCLLIAVSYLMLATPKWIATVTVNKPYLNQLANYPRGIMLSQPRLNSADNAKSDSESETTSSNMVSTPSNVFNAFITVANENPEQQPIMLKPGKIQGTYELSYSDSSAQLAEKNLQSALSALNVQTQQRLYAVLQSTLQERTHSLELLIQAQENNAQAQRQYRLSTLQNAWQIAQNMGIQQSKISQPSGEISDEMLFMLGAPMLHALIEHERSLPLKLDQDYYDAQEVLTSIDNLKLNHDGFHAFSASPYEIYRAGPKRGLILLLSLLLGAIASSGYILLRNAIRNSNTNK